MYQPLGFRNFTRPDYVSKLRKSLYGLKQAPRVWYQLFPDYVSTIGFVHSKSDQSLFIYQQGRDMAYLLLYIDDIILTTSSEPLRQSIMSSLNAKYVEAIIARAGILDYGLHLYKLSIGTLTLYTDADWVGCPDTRKSTSGFFVFLGDNLISWSSKRQATISRSSAKVEYRGVANVVSEARWLQNLLLELHHPLSTMTIVYCDNVSAIYLSGNPVQH
ncbi:hypothetical protein LIER_28624 [Lithospermum erythrorhizon]|uniref:Reverse transcriptase Ty1/copia-type domain-containing protein n=1 Tax=Lithospermum erythrorhizon TaxID=34254 RepID=A0AAV3RI03_LITER